MAEPKEPDLVMLVVAAFSGSLELLNWARQQLQERYGPITLESPLFDFVETRYYEADMGVGLRKRFFAFERLIPPDALVDIKLATNEMERQAARQAQSLGTGSQVPRPVNIDPGYLQLGKWVLATTKDQAHRLYLGRGIFGEVTLRFEHGEFVPWPWTYPNYQREDYRAFFKEARTAYLQIIKRSPHPVPSRPI